MNEKLRLCQENADRLGLTIITTLPGDAVTPCPELPQRRFDRVLVDAPCSGLGVSAAIRRENVENAR